MDQTVASHVTNHDVRTACTVHSHACLLTAYSQFNWVYITNPFVLTRGCVDRYRLMCTIYQR